MAIEFLNDVEINGSLKTTGPLKDSSGDNGTSGQILSSTGTGTNWVDASSADITSVVAGTNLNGGGTSGDVTVNLDSSLSITELSLSGPFSDLYGSVGANGNFLMSNATGGVSWAANPVKYSAVSSNLILAANTATGVGNGSYAPYILLAEANPGIANGEVKKIRLGSISLDRFEGEFGVNERIVLSRNVNNSSLSLAPVYVDNRSSQNGEMYNYASDVSSTFGSKHFGFAINGTITGSISQGTGNVAYNTTGSDRRLKTNIEAWDENLLEKFEKIQPKKFNFLTDAEGDSKQKGYIAQEMVDSFPEAYPLGYGEENYYNYNPSGMVVYLTKAIKELIDKNKELEDRVQKLENK
jgi:hypothetical protein